MFEWMPVWSGAVLGALHARGVLGGRATLLLLLTAAIVSAAVSGELAVDARFLLIDVGLVAVGAVGARLLTRGLHGRPVAPRHTDPSA